MARDGFLILVCAGILASMSPIAKAENTGSENKVKVLLAVQRALREGREQLQRGNYQAAVFLLESQIARANASPEYLTALCEAYRGYVAELRKTGKLDEVAKYQERLEILDPAACLGRKTQTTAATGASPSAAPVVAMTGRPVVTEGRPVANRLPSPGTVRAKLEEDDDPFSDANAVRHAAPALVMAEEEFGNRHYEAATKLYEQAARKGEVLPDGCREHWGYCKLVAIAETLRRTDKAAPSPDLEREVRLAMSLTPKLDSFGKELLRKLQDRQSVSLVDTPTVAGATAIEVRHIPAQEGTWAAVETANFRILHLQSREFAEQIARSAEATRATMMVKWFGEDTGVWKPRCDIFLYATAQDYSQATAAPTNSPGHSTIRRDRDRIISRRIDLHCDDPNMTVGVLPHEITHTVIAGHFGAHDVPRWADEGMAVLSEPRERIERHLRNLPQHRADRHLFETGQLMNLENYPEARYVGSFYAQSVSLVEFLSDRAGPRVFAKFLRDGLASGYEVALQKYYGFQSFGDLEQQWVQHTFTSTTASSYGR
jgi:tetratricopeptide (TPR) repeat protein